MLILGNTAKIHVLLDITISDPSGKIIKKIETFSDKSGMFKVDNFRVPIDGDSGTWIVNVKSGGNFKQIKFFVADDDEGLTLFTDRNEYDISELVNIYGTGARMSSTVTIKIFDSGGDEIQELNISAKGNGEYATIWKIPPDLEGGKYDITADDGKTNVSMKITLNVS